MSDAWTLLRSDRDIGSWSPKRGSPHTEEKYIITVAGTWVPTVDVSWLLKFERNCPCGGQRRRIKMFARVVPSVEQLRKKPAREPRLRSEPISPLGIIKV